jgi:aspartate 1-decarboxylase
MSYAWIDAQKASSHKPSVILLDDQNTIKRA